MTLIAYTREISPALADCELTHLVREPLDIEGARIEHETYEALLASLGAEVRRLPAAPHLPDGVFVEDAAVVLDDVAVITRPGALSRQPETVSVAAALAAHRPLLHIAAPGTLDGGDVLVAGRTLYVGLSTRTSRDAIAQLGTALAPYGYQVVPVAFSGCLHLKSAVTRIADDLVLLNPAWVSPADVRRSSLARRRSGRAARRQCARAGRSGHTSGAPFADPRADGGQRLYVRTVPQAELAKAESGVTCSSLLVTVP